MSQSTQWTSWLSAPGFLRSLKLNITNLSSRFIILACLESCTSLEPDPGTKAYTRLALPATGWVPAPFSQDFSLLPIPLRDSLYPSSGWKGTSFVKNVLGSPTDFCFAIVLRCRPSNRGRGACDILKEGLASQWLTSV